MVVARRPVPPREAALLLNSARAGADNAKRVVMAPTTAACALLAIVAAGCAGPGPAAADAAPTDECVGGGLPAPTCGSGPCSCCVGCSIKAGLCLGTAVQFALGVGQCVAAPAAGSFQVMIGGSAFVADQVAAIVDHAYLQVSARAAGRTVVLLLPNTLGDASCASGGYAGSFVYSPDGASEFRNRPGSPRPVCTVSLVKVGDVGERIEGSFSASVVESSASPATVELTDGAFSVDRGAFP